MTYTSLNYILFTALCLIFYYTFPKKCRWWVLLAASLGFYAIVCLKYIGFIFLTSLSTYIGGLLIERRTAKYELYIETRKGSWTKEEKSAYKSRYERNKKLLTAIVLVINFGILAFLKYYNFFTNALNTIINPLGGELPQLELFLPLGISFYTFQSMGYVIDIYRQKYHAEKNYAKILLFTSFFPQIVQGPISFYSQLSGQLYEGHSLKIENIKQGILLITWGFFKKLIIADRLVNAILTIPQDYERYSGTIILITALFYALQLYADFSGGIDISRGVAQLFGINLDENFKRPYFSRSISEYWRRWHITLGAWLREYLFYPIAMSKLFQKFGKNLKKRYGIKISKVLPVSIASLITFIIIGIWHGAYWKYVGFGLWNGLVIMISTLLEDNFTKWKENLHIKDTNVFFIGFQIIRTFLIVLVGYYFDIAPGFKAALNMMYRSVADFHMSELTQYALLETLGINRKELLVIAAAVLIMLAVSIFQERYQKTLREYICSKNFIIQSLVFMVLFWSVVIFGVYGPGTDPAEFVYMQF